LGARKSDVIVTVSEYWKKYILERHYKKAAVAYNCFDLKEYDITARDVTKFKKKYHLEGKPIIYIGNCQELKGVVDAYEELKDLEVYLVTSGKKEIDIPAIHLDLSKKEYLTLLKASSIVLTMSKFKEGWCRTAHEAMIFGVPVIGTGTGGMGELLTGGAQIITDVKNLRKDFITLMSNPKRMKRQGELGRAYARKFDYKRFTSEWKKIMDGI
jgi:glycosyltransferase involved in cell wall biosynthesis